jgi:hypothetical protein
MTVQSEPCSPATKLAPSDQHDIKNALVLDTEFKSSSKVKKGIRIWKDTYAQYMVDPPPSLEIKVSEKKKKLFVYSIFIHLLVLVEKNWKTI